MPYSSGPNTVNDSIVFNYDTGDLSNSYKGQPITNQFSALGTSGFGPGADNGVSFPVNGTGTFIRLGYGQTFGGYTIQPSDVVYKYDLGLNGCHYHGFDTSIPAGSYATFTFDYLVANAANYPTDGLLANFEIALSYGVAVPNALQNVWQTVTFTAGPTGGGTLRSLLYPGGCSGQRLASSGYILFRNPQVTYTSYAVPFTQSTRSATQALLDISGNSRTIDLVNTTYGANNAISFDGTDDRTVVGNLGTLGNFYSIECVFNSTNVQSYRNVYDMNYSTYSPNTGNVGPRLEQFTNGTFNWIWSGNTSNNSLYQSTTPTAISPNTFYHTVFTLSGGIVNTYKNGVLIDNNVTSPQGYITTFGDVNVGRGFILDSSRYFAGRVPVFKIYNKALTATEVQQNYLAYKTRFNLQ